MVFFGISGIFLWRFVCFVAVRASSLGRAVALWRGVALWGVVAFWCVVAVALWRVVALGRVVVHAEGWGAADVP